MNVIVPQFVKSPDYTGSGVATLLSSSEGSDPTTNIYSSSADYTTGDTVYYLDPEESQDKGIYLQYEALQNSGPSHGGAKDPYTYPSYWVSLGAIDIYKMFDIFSNTTTLSSSSDITVNLHCQAINTIAFLNVQASTITIKAWSGSTLGDKVGDPIFQDIIDLTQIIYDWQGYFFDGFDATRDLTEDINIDLYHNLVIEITFSKITGQDCYIGQCIPGSAYYIGDARFGASSGIEDYSKKSTDETFGYTYLRQGNFKKLLEVDLYVENDKINGIASVLTQLRATPTVWQANQYGSEYDSLLVYGFYKDFSVVHESYNHSEVSLEIEGLI